MTYAPNDLMDVRSYLLGKTGLSGDAIGIVAGPSDAATGGYHCGNDGLAAIGKLNTDYSKRESDLDRPGTNAASALDVGDFTHGGKSLRQLSTFLVSACQKGDTRARDIREIIYTDNGQTVKRWDRLGIRSTGDSSHLYHTHLSFFRDSEGHRAETTNVMGLVREFFEGAPSMALDGIDKAQVSNSEKYLQSLVGMTDNATGISDTVNTNISVVNKHTAAMKQLQADVTVIKNAVATLLAGGGSADTAAIIAHMDQLAAAELARDQADVARHSAAAHAAAEAYDTPAGG